MACRRADHLGAMYDMIDPLDAHQMRWREWYEHHDDRDLIVVDIDVTALDVVGDAAVAAFCQSLDRRAYFKPRNVRPLRGLEFTTFWVWRAEAQEWYMQVDDRLIDARRK